MRPLFRSPTDFRGRGHLLESGRDGLTSNSYRMHTNRPRLSLTMGLVLILAVVPALAAGLGSGGTTAVLGQPLDFAVQVRLDPGETLGPECVQAEVTAGDRHIPPPLVRALVEMTGPDTARVRVVTQPTIDEPVVGIQVSVGCTVRLSRRYVVLADPPSTALVPVAPSLAAAPTAESGGSAAEAAQSSSAAPAQAPLAGSAADARPRQPAPTLTRVARAEAPKASADPELRARAREQARSRAEGRAAAVRQRSQALQAARAAAPAEGPRLKLDVAERAAPSKTSVEDALTAVAQAASAARAAASAASASALRIASLEATVEQLRSEAKASRDLATAFRDRLSRAEGAAGWTMPLMAVAVLLAALAAWLAWRLGRVQAELQQGWRVAAAPLVEPAAGSEVTANRNPTAPIPFVTSELSAPEPAPAPARPRSLPAWPAPVPVSGSQPLPDVTEASPKVSVSLGDPALEPEPPMQRTDLLAGGPRSDKGAPRDVSIEELIDLEQQAEFFVVLGQDDAAIGLLMEHLRSTGGGSPLPYLKLLEIHRRRGSRDAYERMRGHFNQRFNAYAPAWGVDLGHGRALDDYPGVIPRLQEVWPRPMDAMAELEALLFRKSRGELFDLPAYREVLFLYSLARDLLDRAAADEGSVDVLLPIVAAASSSASASPTQGLDRYASRDAQEPDDRSDAALDLDVSVADRDTSMFDRLDDKPQPPRMT